MKELQLPDGRKLLLPVLPMEATDIFLGALGNSVMFRKNPETIHYEEIYMIEKGNYHIKMETIILGTIHREDGKVIFGFDPAPFVEKVAHIGKYVFWMNYMFTQPIYAGNTCGTPEDSFLSLLNAKADIWFVNPLGEEPNMDDYTINNHDRTQTFRVSKYNDAKEAWRAAEEKVVRGKLLAILKG